MRRRTPVEQMLVAACLVCAIGCKNSTNAHNDEARGSGVAESASCDEFSRALCDASNARPDECNMLSAAIDRAELPGSECSKGLESLAALEALPADTRAVGVSQVVAQTLKSSPHLSDEQVESLLAKAQSRVRDGGDSGRIQGPSVATEDADLPRSSGAVFYRDEGIKLRLSAHGAVTVGGENVSSEKIDATFEAMAKKLRAPPEIGNRFVAAMADPSVGGDSNLRIRIHADASAKYGALVQTLRAARDADFGSFGLAVRHDGRLRSIDISVSAPDVGVPDDAISVAVGADGYLIEGNTAATLDELSAAAQKLARGGSRNTVFVDATRDAEIREVVAALDAIRGPKCTLDEAMMGEKVPAECWFWIAVLQLES